jgi:hypothetical protein
LRDLRSNRDCKPLQVMVAMRVASESIEGLKLDQGQFSVGCIFRETELAYPLASSHVGRASAIRFEMRWSLLDVVGGQHLA